MTWFRARRSGPKLRRKMRWERKVSRCTWAAISASTSSSIELNFWNRSACGVWFSSRPAPFPPPPPPHLFELQRIFYFLFSVEQLGSFDIEQIFSPLSLSLSISHTHTQQIYSPTRSTYSLFALAVFLDVRHRSLDDPPTSKYFDRSCLQTTSLKRMFWAFVWYAQLSERIWIRELRTRISKVCFSSALAVYFPPFEPSFFAEMMSFRLSVNMIFDGSIKSFRLICSSL